MLEYPKDILNELSRICRKFLKDNGGYENGYETFIRATFRKNVHSTLEWQTPKYGDLTVNLIKSMARFLYKELEDTIQRGGGLEEKEIIEIYTSNLGDGCYSTKIVFRKEPIVVSVIY